VELARMKKSQHTDNATLMAQIRTLHLPVSKAVADKIRELADGGLSEHEIATHLGVRPYQVMATLRGRVF
jgi:hypothetical protein